MRNFDHIRSLFQRLIMIITRLIAYVNANITNVADTRADGISTWNLSKWGLFRAFLFG